MSNRKPITEHEWSNKGDTIFLDLYPDKVRVKAYNRKLMDINVDDVRALASYFGCDLISRADNA